MKIRSLGLAAFVGILSFASVNVIAQSPVKSIADVYKDKSALSGKTITAQGKVVKVNNGIMDRNFVHVQDGTGQPGSDKLVVTSKQTANVGDQVTISGKVVLDRDFGAGYVYPLLIEEASITPKK